MSVSIATNGPRGLARLLTVCAIALGLSAPPAGAQTSRQAQIAQQQAEKASQLHPHDKTKAEKISDAIGRYLSRRPRRAYPWFGSIYGGGGISFGAGFEQRYTDTGDINLLAAYSIRNYKLLQGLVHFPEASRGAVKTNVGVRWMDATQVLFYGLGNDSPHAGRTSFDYEPLRIDADVTVTPSRWFRFGGGPFFEDVSTGRGAHAQSIEERFTPAEVPGVGEDISFGGARAFAEFDWRTSPGYTRSGGFYAIEWARYIAWDSKPFDFDRVDVDLRQYIPLMRENWVIALRATSTLTTGRDGGDVPYFQMPYLGSGQTLRGFGNHRFIDRNALLLQAEYRWTPSPFVDMAIFYDAGKVAPRRSDLDLNDLHTDWGIGVRFHGPSVTALRVDVARSREGWGLIFGTGLF